MSAGATPLFTVFLQDEAPAIGSGFRFVFAKRGRKWVYLLSPYTMRACKIRRAVWDRLAPTEIIDPTVIGRAQQALRALTRERCALEPTRLQRSALGDGK